jgi:RNA polymerase sigma factor (sigma-70 family)
MTDPATDIFERERRRLTSLAYRMLGERASAEDVVQNAWLRWSATDREKIKTPAAWLTTVTTRLAIDALRSARRNREVYFGVWLPEPILSDPENVSNATATPEDKLVESGEVELALLWAMERLGPEERAAFILREAFDADYADIADTLGKSEANCRQIIARARKKISAQSPKFNASESEVSDLLNRFLAAVQSKNKDQMLELLSPNAIALSDGGGKARAALRPLQGPEDIVQVFLAIMEKNDEVQNAQFVLANGQPAIATLSGSEADLIVTLAPDQEGHIGWIYIMRNPDKLTRPKQDVQSG